VSHRTGPTCNGDGRLDDLQHESSPANGPYDEPYDEKDEPQPQERVEFGLMKLNPWRISVSS